MSVTITISGTQYLVPSSNNKNLGDQFTDFFVAVANAANSTVAYPSVQSQISGAINVLSGTAAAADIFLSGTVAARDTALQNQLTQVSGAFAPLSSSFLSLSASYLAASASLQSTSGSVANLSSSWSSGFTTLPSASYGSAHGGWVAATFNSALQAVKYFKDPWGFVHLVGGATNRVAGLAAGAATVFAQLPAGFRPDTVRYFEGTNIDSNGVLGYNVISLDSNGNLSTTGAPSDGNTVDVRTVFIDGITFPAAGSHGL